MRKIISVLFIIMLLLAISMAAEARGRDEAGRFERVALAGHEKNNTVDANQNQSITAGKNIRRGAGQERNTRTIIILVNKAPEEPKQNKVVNKTPEKRMSLQTDVQRVINVTNITFYNYVTNVTNVTNNKTYNVTYNVTTKALPCACGTLANIAGAVNATTAPQENEAITETEIVPVQPFPAFESLRESPEQRFIPPPPYYDPREWGRIVKMPWGLQIQSRIPQPAYYA